MTSFLCIGVFLLRYLRNVCFVDPLENKRWSFNTLSMYSYAPTVHTDTLAQKYHIRSCNCTYPNRKTYQQQHFFVFSPQCLLGSPVHPHPATGAGKLPAPVAEHPQPVQDQRHLLLLLRHGALHQGPGNPDRDAQGQVHTTKCHALKHYGRRLS